MVEVLVGLGITLILIGLAAIYEYIAKRSQHRR